MKFVRTVVVFDRGSLIDGEQWATIHATYTAALRQVVHPAGNDHFLIRRKIRQSKVSGAKSDQWKRNGVVPIKRQFFANLKASGWESEKPTDYDGRVSGQDGADSGTHVLLQDYPTKNTVEVHRDKTSFHRHVGDFDFFRETGGGLRCAIEWETGNISSSHRSMNKLCLVMLAGLIDIGVVILPSRDLYFHLTDRIGNWMELSPYLPLWHQLGRGIDRGLLAVTVVEHDALTDDPSVPFLPAGRDGRSAEGAEKLL